MLGAAVTLKPPTGDEPREVVSVRCEPEMVRWLDRFVRKPKPSRSEIAAWVFELGRNYYDGCHRFEDQLQEFQREESCSEPEAISRVMALGFAAYQKEKRGKK